MSDLSAEAITRALDAMGAPVGRPIEVKALTGSTNDDARTAAGRGAPHGAAIVADAQTQGRGRGGHTWHSPAGENIYLSMIVRPRVPAASVAPTALAVGAALSRVIEARVAGRAPVWIKWPNDVLVGAAGAGEAAILRAKKIAGVLVEGQLRGSEVASLVVGVGVNVRAAAFPEEIARRATSLAMVGVEDLDRSGIAAEIIAAIGAAIARYEVDRLVSFLPDLERMDALRGARVEVAGVRGEAVGIDAEGRLSVRRSDGTVAQVATGEVALV
ncbi:Biotin--protein ligase [Minicystis rosea]|nr:Biotin--protein ligase [Minicystis rosea]